MDWLFLPIYFSCLYCILFSILLWLRRCGSEPICAVLGLLEGKREGEKVEKMGEKREQKRDRQIRATPASGTKYMYEVLGAYPSLRVMIGGVEAHKSYAVGSSRV